MSLVPHTRSPHRSGRLSAEPQTQYNTGHRPSNPSPEIPVDTPRPKVAKIAETVIHDTVRLREASIGRRCEVLRETCIEYSVLGDYSYLGEHCEVADATIGKFTAIANRVRIGAPNHPMGRPAQHRFT